jgi:hypothetical protein
MSAPETTRPSAGEVVKDRSGSIWPVDQRTAERQKSAQPRRCQVFREGPLTEPTAAARVGSGNRSRFRTSSAEPVFVEFMTYALASRQRGQLDGGEGNEGGQGFGKVLEVLGETPVSSEPGEGALDHPAARQDDKALHIVAPLDDLHRQRRHLCNRSVNCQALVLDKILRRFPWLELIWADGGHPLSAAESRRGGR